MLFVTLVTSLNVCGNPVLTTKIDTDTVKTISVNLPASLRFYDNHKNDSNLLILRITNSGRHNYYDKWINYELKDDVLHINLKNYSIEEMRNLNPNNVRLYIPNMYNGNITTISPFEITTISNKAKNDSGNQTN